MMTKTYGELRVWVGCLACYNDGRLHGEWMEPADGAEWACERAGHEETWVFDHEGFAGTLTGECSPMAAAELAEVLADIVDDGNLHAFGAFVSHVWGADYAARDWPATVEAFRDAFHGEHPSGAAFAEELAYECGQITEDSPLASYIAWDRVWHGDYECDGWHAVHTADGVLIFCPV
jgi:hypothetical protein